MHNDIEARRGLTTGIALYLMWGFFPLYFRLLERSGAFEIIAHRVVWSFAFCAILLTIGKGWHRLAALAHDRRSLWGLVLAGHLVLINWTLYVWSVNAGHTLDAAMGYFINPLVSALLGVLVLRERLRPAQWMAFGIGIVAVVVLMVGHSSTPLISLGLAMSFGLYGLVKKVLGVAVKPAVGLIVETLATTPLALVYIRWGVEIHLHRLLQPTVGERRHPDRCSPVDVRLRGLPHQPDDARNPAVHLTAPAVLGRAVPLR